MINLGIRDLHLWPVEVPDGEARWLSADESERAARFRFERDRRRFAGSRCFLRWVLAQYLACAPEQVTFAYGEKGKPRVGPGMSNPRIRFNLSHSSTMVLCAVALDEEVGTDVEQIRELSSAPDIARRFFEASEFEDLRQLQGDALMRGFFRCWTRKEAYLKALGEGLHGRLDEVPGREWTVMDLDLDPGFAAAVAIRGQGWKVQLFSAVPEPWASQVGL